MLSKYFAITIPKNPSNMVIILVLSRLSESEFCLKSNVKFELIAHSNESLVEIIAHRTASAAIDVINLLEVLIKKNIISLLPTGIFSMLLAAIPKISGKKENPSNRRPAMKADIYAVFEFLAEKNLCAISCSIKTYKNGMRRKSGGRL